MDEVHLSQASPSLAFSREEEKEDSRKFLYEEEEKIGSHPDFGISTFSRVPPLSQTRGAGLSIIPSQQFG